MAQENEKNVKNQEELKEQEKKAENGELDTGEMKEAAGGMGGEHWYALRKEKFQ